MKKYNGLLALLFMSPLLFGQQSNLNIKLNGIEEIKGIIQVAVYNEKETFPEVDRQYRIAYFDVRSKDMKVTIDGLPNGEYAIALYHDVNGDGICNLNLISIPKEPYGFSNNVKPVFSAPTFESTKFALNSDKTIQIDLID